MKKYFAGLYKKMKQRSKMQSGGVIPPSKKPETILREKMPGDEVYIRKSEITRYIGSLYAQLMTDGLNKVDIPPTISPSSYLSGYTDGIKKALDIIQAFEAVTLAVLREKFFIEYAESLKEHLLIHRTWEMSVVSVEDIDNLVKRKAGQ